MDPLPFLDQTIKFLDGTSYERLSPPITDFRQCHGVTPPERRVLYRCRRLSPSPSSDQPHPEDQEQLFILKLKVQIPEPTDVNQPAAAAAAAPPTSNPTQSDATAHELSALQIFRDAGTDYGPRLVDFDSQRQGPEGLLPGGYISCTVMSTIPGKSLFDLGYWSLEADDRAEIQERFLEALS
jgi:predicted component of type VI protein secretion system